MSASPTASGSSIATDSSGDIYYAVTAGREDPVLQSSTAEEGGDAAVSSVDRSSMNHKDGSYPDSSSASQVARVYHFRGSPVSSPFRTSGGDWYHKAFAVSSRKSHSAPIMSSELSSVSGPLSFGITSLPFLLLGVYRSWIQLKPHRLFCAA